MVENSLESMDCEILEIISKHSMFSYDEIEFGYGVVKSYDKLIDATIEAPRLGVSLWDVCEILRFATKV